MKIKYYLLQFLLICGIALPVIPLVAQEIAPAGANSEVNIVSDEPEAPDVIFTNLARAPGERYNDHGFTVAGKTAAVETETWQAIRFVPDVDTEAKVLKAAIGYISGTRRVNLGLYDNSFLDTVGDPLPGGQGSTTQIPDLGECCQLAKVTLKGPVTLNAGTTYWLVASPDNIDAPDFRGAWQLSYLAQYADTSPPDVPWKTASGAWPAAQIRGTNLPALAPAQGKLRSSKARAPAANVTIFTNLDRISTPLYNYGQGAPVFGPEVPFQHEAWAALPFTPIANVHARTLAAAIAWVSGTKLVKLGIYSDDDGTVGTPFPGGQGSTIDIPVAGECCELVKVRLPAPGLALEAGQRYWLVASTDDRDAPDFQGIWQQSSLAVGAYQEPENFQNWSNFNGLWLAAEIRGTNP